MKEITLNPAKAFGSTVDIQYEKLEIPVKLSKHPEMLDLYKEFAKVQVHPTLTNSNTQLHFSYCHGLTQMVASLQGPTEAKFASKQDPAKAYIELSLKDTTNKETLRDLEELRQDLKTVLEQIIQVGAYPKSILTFQVFVVKDETEGTQLFSGCMNALLAVINQAAIAQKIAPCAAITLALKQQKDSMITDIDGSAPLELDSKPKQIQQQEVSLLDIVTLRGNEIVFMKSLCQPFDFNLLFASQNLLTSFDSTLNEMSSEITKSLSQP